MDSCSYKEGLKGEKQRDSTMESRKHRNRGNLEEKVLNLDYEIQNKNKLWSLCMIIYSL